MKRILLIMLSCVMLISAKSQVVIDQHIDSLQILIGEQTRLTLTASFKSGKKLVFPSFKNKMITPGVEVVEELNNDTTDLDNEEISVSKVYVLTSFDENVYRIPSLNINVGGKNYSTKELALKVLTVPVDTLHTDKFYPAKGVQANPFLWSEWVSPFLYSMLFIILLVLSAYLYVRFKKNKPIVSAIKLVKHIPAHKKAIVDIEKLKAERASVSNDQKLYYTQLTSILRKYIAERFKFDAMEMTSSEIIDRLRAEGNAAIDEVVNLFRTADLVKFAKHTVLINENDANLVNALTFINDTKTDEKEEVKVVVSDQNGDKRKSQRRYALKVAIIVALIGAVASLVWGIYQVYALI